MTLHSEARSNTQIQPRWSACTPEVHLDYTERERGGENGMCPFIAGFLSSTPCNSESATGTNRQTPRSLDGRFQVNCIRKSSVLGGKDVGRLTHRRRLAGFTVCRACREDTRAQSSQNPSVDTNIYTQPRCEGGRGKRGQPDDKGCLVRPVYTLSYFGWAFTVDWAHKLSLYPAIMNSTVNPLQTMNIGGGGEGKCLNFIMHQSICVLGQLGHLWPFTTAQNQKERGKNGDQE